ncbi:hypothetical protein SIM91_43665 [Rhodococcus opacus]|nr:hypothetical protein [Rhodococcus opacus]MDX5970059.1 hypothetical protein [Rhodococcus opacus]CAG7634306.1 hypothetical protein E143388_07590 [Rhodococcus opacus]
MGTPVTGPGGTPPPTYATLAAGQRPEYLTSCRALTDSVYAGLDLTGEIESVHTQGIGDTVLLEGDAGLDGLAVCHLGPGSEAGEGVCYVKFGAVRPGRGAADRFERLLDACELLATVRGLDRVEAGMNLARTDAYGRMIDRGYRTGLQGVAMHRPNEAGYSRPDTYVIDDWR